MRRRFRRGSGAADDFSVQADAADARSLHIRVISQNGLSGADDITTFFIDYHTKFGTPI